MEFKPEYNKAAQSSVSFTAVYKFFKIQVQRKYRKVYAPARVSV